MGTAGGHDAYAVDLEALETLITHMQQFTNATDANVELIDAYTANMPWEGQTEHAHKQWQAQWRSGIQDLQEGLRKIRDSAKTAHGNYTSAINANLKMWGP